MVQRDVGQDLVDLFLAVVHVHVLAAYFVLFLLVADDPVASGSHEAHLLGDLREALSVDDDCTLSNSLFALYLRF